MNEKPIEMNSLDILDDSIKPRILCMESDLKVLEDIVRNRILCIKGDIKQIRKHIVKYEESRLVTSK